jgi:alpha-ketoglutarate-dependent taurine dioxygenase
MPFHFDGVFKTKTNEDGSITADPPQFQVFQCRHAPSADDPAADAGGRTLFSSSSLIYSQVLANNVSPYADDIKNRKWTVFTPTNQSFGGGEPLKLPLIETNPLSGRKVVRWHEEWCVYSCQRYTQGF